MSKTKPTRRKKQLAKRELAAANPKCHHFGGKKKNGDLCGLKAGFGTEHEGTGLCRYHGGLLPNQKLKHAKEEVNNMATPVQVTPGQALLGVLHLSAGQLMYVSAKVAELDDKEVMGEMGLNRWVRLQRSIMQDVAKFGKIAADAGIDERMVRLAEQQTHMIARVFEAVAKDLEFTPQQKAALGPAVRRHLAELSGIQDNGNAERARAATRQEP